MANKMNIIVVSYTYPRKSNARMGIFVHQRAKYIARAGHNVDVITAGSYDDGNFESRDNVNIYRVSSIDHFKPISGFWFTLRAILKLYNLAKSKKIDFVMQEFVGVSTIFIGIFLKIKGVRFVLVSHGTKWELEAQRLINKTLIRWSLSFPEKIICVSKNIKDRLITLAGENKLFVVNNGMDPGYLHPSKNPKEFRKELGIKNDHVLLTVSNLVKKKGIDVIIKTFARLLKKQKNIVYIIVGGEGSEKERLKELVKELKISNKVRFEGQKVGSELANYYSICDLFVVMSRDIGSEVESFGIVYIEASYFGKPVVGGISGGTSDAVIDGKTGFLIDAKDQKKLEKTLLLLLKNKKLRENLGKAGKERVLNGFLWSHSVEKLLNILKKM